MMAIEISALRGDITEQNTDAIVNAANRHLKRGGGVDGAIHAAAGPMLQSACDAIPGGCPTGEARITPGFRLRARWIIHTAGPVWQGGQHREPELLASCYRNSLTLATERGLRSIAFPSISTGIYGFPKELAAPIAVEKVRDFLAATPTTIERVIFVCYDGATVALYERALSAGSGDSR